MSVKKAAAQSPRPMKLGDVLDIENFAIVTEPGVTYKYLGLEYIEQQTGRIIDAPETDGSSIQSQKYLFTPSHVLYGKLRPNLNKVGMPNFSGVCSTDILPLAVRRNALRDYVAFFLRSAGFVHHAVKHAAGTKMPRFGPRQFLETPIPLPSLPVQERIVQVLQKADDVRRKRQEALGLADAVLPAAYRELFGDPDANPYDWPIGTLGEYLEDSRYGTSRQTSPYSNGDPVLRIPNVINGTIDTTDLKYLQVSDAERRMLLLREGDVLVVRTNGNKDYVGRCAVFDRQEEFLFASYLIRLRSQPQRLNPHYLVALLSTPYGRKEIDLNSRTSAGQYNISSTGLRSLRILIPPMPRQLKFVDQYEQWREAKTRLESGFQEARLAFAALLEQAFTGKLTATWEEVNAGWIAEQGKLQECLPRMLLLSLIREKERRAEKDAAAAVLVTALMKYAFLFQMEGNGRRRLYHFVPYHYGPFAKQLYEDLQGLVQDGVVRVENDQDEEKTRITLVDTHKADEMLAKMPEDAKADVVSIVEMYGLLNHRNLLKVVYKKYPAYAKKSKVSYAKKNAPKA